MVRACVLASAPGLPTLTDAPAILTEIRQSIGQDLTYCIMVSVARLQLHFFWELV